MGRNKHPSTRKPRGKSNGSSSSSFYSDRSSKSHFSSRRHSKPRKKSRQKPLSRSRSHSIRSSRSSSRGSTETIKASPKSKLPMAPQTQNSPPSTSLIIKPPSPLTEVRSKIYNSTALSLNIYSNFTHVDISQIPNIYRKMVIYNLPEVNDDEIQQYFITLLKHLTPNIGLINPIVSLDKRDNGFYYIIEVASQDQVEILKNLDNTEWRGYRIRIQRPKNFFRDYNDTQGKVAIPKEIKKNDIESDNKLYMCGIPPSAKESEIRNIVESFGQLKSFNLIRDQNDGNLNRGFCFFEYVSEVVTERAIKGLSSLGMGDKKFKVQRATVNNKSFTILNELKNNTIDQSEDNKKKDDFKPGFSDKNEVSFEMLETPFYATTPSRVMQIINILTPEDLMDDEEYKEIVEDIRSECMTFGTVLNVEIPRPDKSSSLCGAAVGKIFIKFSTIEASKRARYELSGRRFNGRIVVGSFYPENFFDVREFNYQEK